MYFAKVAALIAEKFELPVESVTIETNIIEDKLVLIDEKKSIFNPESKEDLQKALIDAKADLELNLDAKALMTKATEEVKAFITMFLHPYIGDRTLDIKFQ